MLPYLDPGQNIPMYGVMIYLGIVVCAILIIFLNTNSTIPKWDRIYASCFAFIGALLGAKLLSILTSIPIIIEQQIPLENIIKTGFVFYGGLLGGLIGISTYALIYQQSILQHLDYAAVILPLGQAFGRIGCFLAGCCYGRHTNSFLGVVYHVSADPHTPLGEKILPTQLFESGYCLILFLVLIFLSRKKRQDGLLAFIYITVYSACRMINEIFRGDEARGFFLGLSTSQCISIVLLLAAFSVLIYQINKRKKLPS